MAAAHLVTIAEAVKDSLATAAADGQFAQEFSPVRSYRPEYSLEELSTLRVTVIGRKETPSLLSRGPVQVDYSIDVGVQKKVAKPADTTEGDSLMLLVEGILDWFRTLANRPAHPETGAPLGTLIEMTTGEGDATWSPEYMREHGAFSAVVSLTFRGFR